MTISRDDIDRGRVSLGTPGETAEPPPTPGEVLRAAFLEPLGLTPYRLARDLGVPPNRVTAILNGDRAISAETALRLGRYFALPAQFFLSLQDNHDLRIVAARDRDALDRIVPRTAAE